MIAIKEIRRLRNIQKEPPENKIVKSVISKVRGNGDKALKEFTLKFDGIKVKDLKISEQEIKNAVRKVDADFLTALKKAKNRIEIFHRMQIGKFKDWMQEIHGISVGEIFKPLQKVGIYVPAGKAPLPSSLLMAGIPAKIAGVKRIVVATPPRSDVTSEQAQKDSVADPHILATANLLGIKEIYKVGGAQAIAALAYGTETIPKVDKIVGPGNIYVTTAKKMVYGDVGIDMLAGPSEVTVIADGTANAEFIAHDLLSQIEHGPHSPAVLISASSKICKEVKQKIKTLLSNCDKNIKESWRENGGVYLVKDLNEACKEVNKLAPEHLILEVKDPIKLLAKIQNAGTIFLGNYSPVTLGDYIAGPNHILPVSKTARWDWPLGIKDFLKCSNVISATKSSLKQLESSLKLLTDVENMKNHFQAVKVRNEKRK